ncbi:YdcF family protein [Saccharopolyspora pogona]|uniref:YdcF family protein n=1 Tax=Saccharopolyspora pogona TaxID=333966 RepID=UPI001684CAAD|nr:YdcF family protein [Saccharopolyspora pogona]
MGERVTSGVLGITEDDRRDAGLIWEYHQMAHETRSCSTGIGLGSHDLGVAAFSAELYRQGRFPVLVFTGANSPTTAERFPRGEAVHFREHAIGLGVPDSSILVEPHATNTGENIALSRELLAERSIAVDSVLLICKPYMQRRAFATCRKMWPEVGIVCASEPLSLDDYTRAVGDERLVIDMLVGDFQRIVEYPKLGFAVEQDVPEDVARAYERLVNVGFDTRLLVS